MDVLDVEWLTRRERLSRAQINNLQVVTVVHQHVVRLQVKVDHPAAVQVVDCAQNLNQQLCNMILCVQISTRAQAQVLLSLLTACHCKMATHCIN